MLSKTTAFFLQLKSLISFSETENDVPLLYPRLFGSVLAITPVTGDVITSSTSRLLLLVLSLGFDGSLQDPRLFTVYFH